MEQTLLMKEQFEQLDILVDKVVDEKRNLTVSANDETYGIVMSGVDLQECELSIYTVDEEGKLVTCLATLEVTEGYGDLTILGENAEGVTLTSPHVENISNIINNVFAKERMHLKFV